MRVAPHYGLGLETYWNEENKWRKQADSMGILVSLCSCDLTRYLCYVLISSQAGLNPKILT